MSDKTEVPEEAVEAATDAFSDAYDASEPDLGEQILAALEAAAPFIGAKALEEAARAAEGMHEPVAPDCKEWADWLRARAAAVRGEG